MINRLTSDGGFGLRPAIQFCLFALVVALVMVGLNVSIWDNTNINRQFDSCEVNHQAYGYVMKYRYTPDAKNYILKAAGYKSFPPYKYRVLTPTLTSAVNRWIPGIDEAMFTVNMLALYLFYLVCGLTVFYLGGNFWQALAGLAGVLSFWHLYNYANPYTVEPVFYLMAALLIYAVVTQRFWLFVIVLAVGMLNKESLLFLAPAWFVTRQWRKATLAVVLGLTVYILPRFGDLEALGWSLNHYGSAVMVHNVKHWPVLVITILWAWGLFWIIGYLGARKNKTILWVFGLQTAGALIAVMGAADHGRMMASISPAMFPAISLFFKGVKL